MNDLWNCFNPCFGGNQKSNKNIKNICYLTNNRFNPCFGGNQKSNPDVFYDEIYRAGVSILVLVEIRNQMQTILFQLISHAIVSILVLVEIRNQILTITQMLVPVFPSFNPCFGGNQKSNYAVHIPYRLQENRFNPCFGGNQKSNRSLLSDFVVSDFGFNPCFGGNQKSNFCTLFP